MEDRERQCRWNYDCLNCGAPDCIASGDEILRCDGAKEKERTRSAALTYYARHRDEINARRRAYREANGDEVRKKERARRAKRTEEQKEKKRAYKRDWERRKKNERERAAAL